MVQSMVSVAVISLMVWVSIPHMGTWDPLGNVQLLATDCCQPDAAHSG